MAKGQAGREEGGGRGPWQRLETRDSLEIASSSLSALRLLYVCVCICLCVYLCVFICVCACAVCLLISKS